MVRLRHVVQGAALASAGFGALNVLARTRYRSFLYPAPKFDHAKLPENARPLDLRAADGVRVRAAFFDATSRENPAPMTLALFHGNGEALGQLIPLAACFVRLGVSVALLEYRGYGKSFGEAKPTEAGLYADARCLLHWLDSQGIGPTRITALGISLGTGVATQMAHEHRVGTLVLVTPYTSIPAMVRRFAPFLPTKLLVGDRYDTLTKAPSIARPTLVIHGTEDELIPYKMGATLAATFPHATLRTVLHGHHNDLFAKAPELVNEIVAFMNQS